MQTLKRTRMPLRCFCCRRHARLLQKPLVLLLFRKLHFKELRPRLRQQPLAAPVFLLAGIERPPNLCCVGGLRRGQGLRSRRPGLLELTRVLLCHCRCRLHRSLRLLLALLFHCLHQRGRPASALRR